jgi:formyltetrahydrofolate deformylase
LKASDTAILLVDCPDRRGLVAIAQFLYAHGANIVHADQHQDNESSMFFMRVEWTLDQFDLGPEMLRAEFEPIAERFGMRWRIEYSSYRPRVAIFMSRYQHCLIDLLHRKQIGGFPCEVVVIIGNHPDAGPLAQFYDVPFHHFPVGVENKTEAEARQITLLERIKSSSWCWPAICRYSRPLLWAGIRVVSSTSTTRFCPPSRELVHTTPRMSRE